MTQQKSPDVPIWLLLASGATALLLAVGVIWQAVENDRLQNSERVAQPPATSSRVGGGANVLGSDTRDAAPDTGTTLTEDAAVEEAHPVEDAAGACRTVIEAAAQKYSVDKDRFFLNADGALSFAVAPNFSEQVDYLDCLFEELGTTEIIRTNVWNSTTDMGRQAEEQDGVEYQYSVQTNQYGGNELQIAIQEVA